VQEWATVQKTSFHVPAMDCAAEENLVRMKLQDATSVRTVDVDLTDRRVYVFHDGDAAEVADAMDELGLGSQLLETVVADANEAVRGAVDRRLLWTVLLINFGFFAIEMTSGLLARSMGLVADSLDMLADAMVYGLSLTAVGGTLRHKKAIAKWSGYLQLTLAGIGFVEVLRRVIGVEPLPDFRAMIVVSILALGANVVSLVLLQRSKSQEVHMRATMIFTSNDIVINLGVIAAGLLVLWLGSSVPDLVIGAIVFGVVSRGAIRILKLAA
jgi:Co/Zn/Cd efflux system component